MVKMMYEIGVIDETACMIPELVDEQSTKLSFESLATQIASLPEPLNMSSMQPMYSFESDDARAPPMLPAASVLVTETFSQVEQSL
jgi:hypothetical protein